MGAFKLSRKACTSDGCTGEVDTVSTTPCLASEICEPDGCLAVVLATSHRERTATFFCQLTSQKDLDLNTCCQEVGDLCERDEVADMWTTGGSGTPVSAKGPLIFFDDLFDCVAAEYFLQTPGDEVVAL